MRLGCRFSSAAPACTARSSPRMRLRLRCKVGFSRRLVALPIGVRVRDQTGRDAASTTVGAHAFCSSAAAGEGIAVGPRHCTRASTNRPPSCELST